MKPGRHCHAELVNTVVFAIYKAITDQFGEPAWDVIYRSGEIMWQDLKKELNVTETEPLPVMQKLSQWLMDVGYLKEIGVSQPSEDELVYEMDTSLCRPAVMRLREVNAVLPHWSTGIMVAALREQCGIEADVDVAKPEILSPTRTRERWKIKRLPK